MAPQQTSDAESSLKGFSWDNWVWDDQSRPNVVQLSDAQDEAYFYIDPVIGSTGTAGVRGNKGFADGEHYWEVEFLEPPVGASVMVGVGTQRALLNSKPFQCINLIGQDCESWGLSYKGKTFHNGVGKKYCEPFFEASTKIGLHLNMCTGTLTFFKNGVNLGVAFTGLNRTHSQLYPMISSTSSGTELRVGVRTCRYLSLQEKCFSAIRHSIRDVNSVNDLPLPNIMKDRIRYV